jgi:hypothetical protein
MVVELIGFNVSYKNPLDPEKAGLIAGAAVNVVGVAHPILKSSEKSPLAV